MTRMTIAILSLCVLFSVFSVPLWFDSVFAASPSLGSIVPRGGQRGTEMVLIVQRGTAGRCPGSRCCIRRASASRKLEVVNDNQVKATVKIAPDCRLGEHAMRLRTATGISELRTFWVGALPVVDEKEPNSDFAAPQKIPLNVTVHGVVDSEDVDYFARRSEEGPAAVRRDRRRCGWRTRSSIRTSPSSTASASSWRPPTTRRCWGRTAVASIVVPADGTYVVQVRESAYGGNGACQYRLHVGTFPRPPAVVPAGGKPRRGGRGPLPRRSGGRVQAEDQAARRADREVRRLRPGRGRHLARRRFRSASPSSATSSRSSRTTRTRPRRRPSCRWRSTASSTSRATSIASASPAKKGQTFDVHCYARRLGSPLDPVMTLSYLNGGAHRRQRRRRRAGQLLPLHRSGRTANTSSASRDHLGKGGPTYFYRVEFTPVQADGDGEHSQGGPVLAGTADDRRAARQSLWRRWSTSAGPTSAASWSLGADGLAGGRDAARREHGRQPRRGAGRLRGGAGRAAGRHAGRRSTAKHVDPKQTIDEPVRADGRVGDGRPGTVGLLEARGGPRRRSPSRTRCRSRSASSSRRCRWCRTAR